MSRYLLVDGNALAHRLWWAAQHDVPARFKAAIERVAAGQKAALHTVAWDTPGANWRRDLWNGYKAGRKPKPALLTAALEACRRTRLPHVAAPGFEADDILGTLADYFVSEGHEVAILTHDKDLAQLVSACCWIVDERGKEMREAQVRARFGVDPCHVRHWLSWVGDTADGLPGVAGVGPKKAAPLAGVGAIGDRLTYELAGLAQVPGLVNGGGILARPIGGVDEDMRGERAAASPFAEDL